MKRLGLSSTNKVENNTALHLLLQAKKNKVKAA
jgi:hypothetical protein